MRQAFVQSRLLGTADGGEQLQIGLHRAAVLLCQFGGTDGASGKDVAFGRNKKRFIEKGLVFDLFGRLDLGRHKNSFRFNLNKKFQAA